MSELENDTGFGEPKYTSGGQYAKRIKLEKGHNIVRVMPPLKSLAESGDWNKFHAQHFGFFVPNVKDADKPIPSPWECVEIKKGRDGIIVQECPECELRKSRMEMFNERKAEAESKGLEGEELEAYLGPLKRWLKDHNLDKKYYINVKTMDGQFGYMALPWKAYKALKDRIDELRADGEVDPLRATEGCWFDIVRTGEGFTDTDYKCDFVWDSTVVDGKKMKSLKPAPLTRADYDAAMRDCADLATEVTRRVTLDQAKMLSGGSGDPEEVAQILNLSRRRESSPERSPEPKKVEAKKPEPKVEKKAAPAFNPESGTGAFHSEENNHPAEVDDEEAALLKKLEEARKKKAAAAAVAKAPEKTVKVEAKKPAVAPADLSDDDFLAMFPDPTKSKN